MSNSFLAGASFFIDEYAPRLGDIGSITANNLGADYLSSIDKSIKDLADSVNSFKDNNNPQAFGLVQEAFQAGSFNVDAAGKQTGEYAMRLGSNRLGSADIVTSWNEDYGLKFYKSAYGSAHAQSVSIEHEYLAYCRDFLKKNPGSERPTAQEYLVKNGLDPNTDMSLPLYASQALLCPADQIKDILTQTEANIAKLREAGDTTGTLERLINLKEKLTDHISSPKGAESMRITRQQADDIAKLAKAEKFDPKDYDITIASKADQVLLWRNAALSGLNAAWLSALLKSAPKIIDSIRFAVEEGYISADDIREIGKSASQGASEGFIRGLFAAAITTFSMEGYLGESFKKLALSKQYCSIIGVAVVITIQTTKDFILFCKGDISKEELAYQIDKTLFITGWSVGLGIAAQSILPFVPVVSYMLGSMIGSILGGIVYNLKEKFFIGLSISHGYTFWGLVEQDYHMPPDIAKRLGYETYDYAVYDYEKYSYEKYPYARYEYADFNYEKLDFSYPKRGVIGIRKVGYIGTH